MNEIEIMILPRHSERGEGEAYFQGCCSEWQSVRRYRELEIIVSTEFISGSDAAKKVFLEIVEEIHKDIRRNIRLVRKLLNLGEDSGFFAGTCISFAKTSAGYVKYYDYWGGLAEQRLGETFRDALLTRVKTIEKSRREANKRKGI